MLESQYDFKTRGLQSFQKLILTFDAFSSPNMYKSTLSNSKKQNPIFFLAQIRQNSHSKEMGPINDVNAHSLL